MSSCVPSPSSPSATESAASVAGTKRSLSTLSRPVPTRSALRPVVTSPPWAKDEPESPTSVNFSFERSPRPSGASTTHVPSIVSEHTSLSTGKLGGHHRWTFALPRTRPKPKRRRNSGSSSESSAEGTVRENPSFSGPSLPSRPKWPNPRKRSSPEAQPDASSSSRPPRLEDLHLELPPPNAPFTLSHTKTPGWNSPWTPRMPQQAYIDGAGPSLGLDPELNSTHPRAAVNDSMSRSKERDKLEPNGLRGWRKKKKAFRSLLLRGNYIPLVSRLLNMTFTTTTLALAIRIRLVEQHNHLRGAVGSSPVLAIIFAPATMVHVMVAIYLEYFGRPLGLWRTSAKLFHTLSEVLFICAWSAELSLCFDNYFTSPLQCAPHSAVSWYSELPPFQSPLGNNATGDLQEDASQLCDYQRDLIGVVMVALLLYCTNLVISLFRIFEKVKVHQGWGYAR